jgi:Transglutaminase-like superfamily
MYVSQSHIAAGEPRQEDAESLTRWLRATTQLDFKTPKLRTTMLSLTQLIAGDRDKAVALHDFVKKLRFGVNPDDMSLKASDVLKQGFGDCFTKGMLFVALLRCAGIPARLQFVSLPSHFLYGIIDAHDATIVHALAQVHLDGQWVTTDSYVPDLTMQLAAIDRLSAEDRMLGYGIHRRGAIYWLGRKDASAQTHASDESSMPTVDWGIADDPMSFYADPSHSELRRSFAERLKWRIAAPIVNKRTEALRAEYLARNHSA